MGMQTILDTILVFTFLNLLFFAIYTSTRIYLHGNSLQRSFFGIFLIIILLVVIGPLNMNFTGSGIVDRLITSTLYLYGYPLVSFFIREPHHNKSVHQARRHLGEHVKHWTDADLTDHLKLNHKHG
jgi:hypothetical protein